MTFEDKVKVTVMDDEGGGSYDFSVGLGSFDDWDSKPWSLYGGAFTGSAQKRMIRIATTLHHGGPGCEDVRGRGGEGTAHCPLCGDDQLQLRLHREEGQEDGDQGEHDYGGERVQEGKQGQGEDTEVIIHTFGLLGGYLGKRSKKVRTSTVEDEGELREVVRALWTGFADEYMELVSPEPQPPPLRQSKRAIIEKFLVANFLHPDDPIYTIPTIALSYVMFMVGETEALQEGSLLQWQQQAIHGMDSSGTLHWIQSVKAGMAINA